MIWDPTITLGAILTILTMAGSVGGVYLALRVHLAQLQQAFTDTMRRVESLEHANEKTQAVLMVQNGVLQRLIGRLERLYPEEPSVNELL